MKVLLVCSQGMSSAITAQALVDLANKCESLLYV